MKIIRKIFFITFLFIIFVIAISIYFIYYSGYNIKDLNDQTSINELFKYAKLHNKKILIYGTSIGVDSNSKGDFKKSFIRLISDKNGMNLTNKSQSGCTGVYIKSIKNSGYFKFIKDLDKDEIQKYDYIIIEGFANDAENKNIKISTFKNDFKSTLQYLKENKKSQTKIIVVTTPKLPSGYGKEILERQSNMWKEVKKISKENEINYCDTYDVDAHYLNESNDHPTDEGQKNMAEIVEECILNSKY